MSDDKKSGEGAAGGDAFLSHWLSSDALHKVTLGKGVVGKITQTGLYTVVGLLAAVPFTHNDWLQAAEVLLAFVTGMVSMHRVDHLTRDTPGAALLESADFLSWHRLEKMIGFKGGSHIQALPAEAVTEPGLPALPAGQPDSPDVPDAASGPETAHG